MADRADDPLQIGQLCAGGMAAPVGAEPLGNMIDPLSELGNGRQHVLVIVGIERLHRDNAVERRVDIQQLLLGLVQ